MRTDSASSRGQWLPKLVALLLLGAALLIFAASYLSLLPASPGYSLAAGIGLAISGLLLFKLHPAVIFVYALSLLIDTAWAVSETGLVLKTLLPMLALPLIFGLLLLVPWVRKPLRPQPVALARLLLSLALCACLLVTLASQFSIQLNTWLGKPASGLNAPKQP